MQRTTLALATFVLTAACSTSRPVSTPAVQSPLQNSLTKIASSIDGIVAVTVHNLQTGERASVHGDVRLPTMSVFKLPLAIAALSHVDDGSYRLDQQVTITEPELRPSVSPIADEWKTGQHTFTLETVLRRMLQDSDNTAGDKLVAMLGAKDATARLCTFGVTAVDIAEQEIEMFARVHCPGSPMPPGGWTFPQIGACPNAAPEVNLAAARHEIDASPNGATTDALVNMLAIVDRGAALSANSRAWLHETLAGTKTGAARIPAGVPAGTRVEATAVIAIAKESAR